MLAELPFVSSAEIAAEYKPGAGTSPKAALRALGSKGLVSSGIRQSLRDGHGRMGGTFYIYSSLNVDAARLHRHGDDLAAAAAAKQAAAIERNSASKRLAGYVAPLLADNVGLPDALTEALRGDMGDALRSIAEKTGSKRRKLSGHSGLEAPLYARIVKLHGDIADLAIEGRDSAMSVPTADLAPSIAHVEGTIVALRWQSFGPGMTLLTTCPGMDLGGADDPYERPLPSLSARVDITGTLAGGPTIRRPARIEISGTK